MDQPSPTEVDHYIDQLFQLEDEALAAALRSTVAAGLPQIQVSPSQGKLLYLLAKMIGARRVLEIGCLAGYSAIWLGRALPPGGRLISLEVVARHAKVATENLERAGLDAIAEVRLGPAAQLLAKMVAQGEEPFDLIFIDADKEGYAAYLEWSMRLSRGGTVIVADNVIRAGRVLDGAATDPSDLGARNFNAALADDPRLEAVVLQVVGVKGHDGLAIARVR